MKTKITERETAIGQWEVNVELIVKLGVKKFPLTVDAARNLRDKLNDALRPRP